MGSCFKIAIVEDNVMYSQILSMFINTEFVGVKIDSFESVDCFLNSDNLNKYKLVLLDYTLNINDKNSQSGLDVLKKLKKNKYTAPIVAVSGCEDTSNYDFKKFKQLVTQHILKDDQTLERLKFTISNILNNKTIN